MPIRRNRGSEFKAEGCGFDSYLGYISLFPLSEDEQMDITDGYWTENVIKIRDTDTKITSNKEKV